MKYMGSYKKTISDFLSKASESLNLAKSKADEIVVPSDFSYANGLANVLSDIKEISIELISIEVQKAEDNYEKVEALNQGLASNMSMSSYEYSTKESVEVFLLKQELNSYVTKDSFYYKELVNSEDCPKGVVKNCMTSETKKELQEMINAIDNTTIKNSGTDIETFKKNLEYAIALSNKYVYVQERDLRALNMKKTDKDIKLEQDNIIEHMNNVINSGTHVKDDGYLYIYKNGKDERVTKELWLDALQESEEYTLKNSSCRDDEKYSKKDLVPEEGTLCYGNSGATEAGQKQNSRTNGNDGRVRANYHDEVDYVGYSSCDRFVSIALNTLGLYDDQTLGGENVCREEYLTNHGFESVEDLSDIRPGDIIEINGEHSEHHFFVIAEYDEETGLCTKYDMGSYARFLNEQPNDEVPLIEDAWFKTDQTKKITGIYRIKE